jgi:pterin-4a-carbinolamine dehydratase
MEINDRSTQDAVAGAADAGPFPGTGTELKPERVQEMLQALPGWALAADGKAIERYRSLPSGQVAALFAAYLTTFAKAVGQPLRLGLTDKLVKVSLHAETPCGEPAGLTESVFEFAHRIS